MSTTGRGMRPVAVMVMLLMKTSRRRALRRGSNPRKNQKVRIITFVQCSVITFVQVALHSCIFPDGSGMPNVPGTSAKDKAEWEKFQRAMEGKDSQDSEKGYVFVQE